MRLLRGPCLLWNPNRSLSDPAAVTELPPFLDGTTQHASAPEEAMLIAQELEDIPQASSVPEAAIKKAAIPELNSCLCPLERWQMIPWP